jgi:hypothetical protein
MSSFLVLLAAVASSALPQYPAVPFNNGPQFSPTFQKFPQQFAGLPFPQPTIPFWFNQNQILGGQASLPPWLKPQADPLAVDAVEAVNDVDAIDLVDTARFIDNTEDSKTAATAVAVDDAAAAQKAYEDYLKLCYTTNGGYSGSYSQPTGML